MNVFFTASSISVAKFLIEVIVFLILTGLGILLIKKTPKISNRLLNPEEYLPEDEIHTLMQVAYLSMMAACFICAMYVFVFQGTDFYYFAVLDIIVSLFIAVTMDKSGWRKLLLILIVPYGSLTFLIFGYSLLGIIDFIHIPVMVYFIKVYYDKFKEYTEANSLGITILLLFTIVFLSSLNTIFVESKNPLDAFVMVSNAFTSNGYAVLGTTVAGKINSIILVWSGFMISSVGTATLTFALLTRHYNKKVDELTDSVNELKELIRERDD